MKRPDQIEVRSKGRKLLLPRAEGIWFNGPLRDRGIANRTGRVTLGQFVSISYASLVATCGLCSPDQLSALLDLLADSSGTRADEFRGVIGKYLLK